jgi:polyhydroxyalkanoate synthase subunit PhaC
MPDAAQPNAKPVYDPIAFTSNMAQAAFITQAIVQKFVLHQPMENASSSQAHIGKAFMDITAKMLSDPSKLMERQMDLWKSYMGLWQRSTECFLSGESCAIPTDLKDKRFKDPAWQQNPAFDFIRQTYQLTANWLQGTLGSVEGVDDKTARKVDFYARQFIDALSPSNFLMTNPEAWKATLESNGENLVVGLNNLLEDLERGKGKLSIRMTDPDAFKIGKNLALTAGKVVYQNDLMQLIQYSPTTKDVHATPVLMIPAWINKFYILDLQPANSLVKYLVDQGHTVFMVSWVNPTEKLARKTFEDYLNEGPLAALDVIESITGETAINAVGYCLGGTLLATTLAYLHQIKQGKRIKSATYFTTMIDFADAGELAVFIDEDQLANMEERMAKKGYLEGSEMAMTFNMLRANDLIWSFVVNNYLLGKDPFPFDLLYWNADSTRMPAAMHSFYLRNMYQKNLLIRKFGISINDEMIDVASIATPSMFISTRDDHIAPWKSTYQGAKCMKNAQFVLSASGHIAGIINPPAKQKYVYWTNAKIVSNADEWLSAAKENAGSWWPHWEQWLRGFSEGTVPARKTGSKKFKPIEDAPGSYVQTLSVPD